MARPTVTDATEDVYGRLPFYVRSDDEAGDYPLLSWLSGAGEQAASSYDLLRISDPATSVSGTCEIANPEYAPRAWLRWLGWLVGIDTSTLADAIVRDTVTDVATSQRRGTVAAIKAVTARTLTGSRDVFVVTNPPTAGTSYTYEETGEVYESSDTYDSATHDPYHIIVVTWTSQTPDDAATLAAAYSEKPAGCTMDLQVLDGLTYTQLAAAYATYDAMTGTGLSYSTLSSLT